MNALGSRTPWSVRFVIVGLCLVVSTFARAQYAGVLLQPAGFTTTRTWGLSGNSQVGEGFGTPTNNNFHALIWSGTASSYLDLNPSGFSESVALGASGNTQTGYGYGPSTGNNTHALLWTGTPGSVVDLNPTAGYTRTYAEFISGNTQVGAGIGTATGNATHAVMWTGTASSLVDLNPTGWSASYALGASTSLQVGHGNPTITSPNHAVLWSGTPASAIDLNPPGFFNSVAIATTDTSQVGQGFGAGTSNNFHALLWSGTPASAVDLNPAGFTTSYGNAISGNTQVGYGSGTATGNNNHAVLWKGTAASAVDLHPFLTGLTYGGNPLVLTQSQATGVDGNGDIVGIGADAGGTQYAVMWVPARPVAGTVALQNYSAGAVAGTQVTFEIRTPGTTTVLDTHTVPLDSNGNFAFGTTLPPGLYDITAKASHWLRQNQANQTIGAGGLSGLTYSLTNGDVNGDNVISLADFGQLRAAFGSSSGSNNWNPNADLNGDGVVSLADFGILRANFGKSGDP